MIINQSTEKNFKEALTLTIPATKAPQLNVPISFGIEINLQKPNNVDLA